jgi:anti-sigma factor RsiW
MNGEHPSKENLQRHYDGELSDQEAAQLGLHLPSCAACTAELAELERLSDMVRSSSAESVAAANVDFTRMFAEIERAVSQPRAAQQNVVVPLPQNKAAARGWGRAAAPALGGLALAAAVLLMFTRQEPVPQQEVAMLYATNHTEVTAMKFGLNSGQLFDIPLAEGESAAVVWIDDLDENEEE